MRYRKFMSVPKNTGVTAVSKGVVWVDIGGACFHDFVWLSWMVPGIIKLLRGFREINGQVLGHILQMWEMRLISPVSLAWKSQFVPTRSLNYA